MGLEDSKNLRCFTRHFAKEFVIPQITFWFKNIFQKQPNMIGLEKEYYDIMEKDAKNLRKEFSPPYDNNYWPYNIVISTEEVEQLKGIIGDNYKFLKKRLLLKEILGTPLINKKEDKEALEMIDICLRNIPNFQDFLEKSFFIPFQSDQIAIREGINFSLEGRSGIFFCYSSKDREIIQQFKNNFEEENIKIWFDMSGIFPGDSIPQKIAKGMKEAKFVFLFVSENLNSENLSPYISWELSMAKVKDLEDDIGRLIPILIGNSSSRFKIPQEVIDKCYADFRDKKEISKEDLEFQRILRKIKP